MWALWLGAPFAVTLLAAAAIWWRGRPRRAPSTRESMAEHRAYLDALERARSRAAERNSSAR